MEIEKEKKHYNRLIIAEEKRKEMDLQKEVKLKQQQEEQERKELDRLMKKYKVGSDKPTPNKSYKEKELDFGGASHIE
jgi:hypothetical protein